MAPMSTALRRPRMTRQEFLDWVATQEGRWEFDGYEPVPLHGPRAMTGGTLDHSRISQNVSFALRSRLRGSPCEVLGPDAGVAAEGDVVRFPDVLVTCTRGAGTARLAPAPVVVFEVLSPTSGRLDRIVKLREYRAVPSIRRYVIPEHASAALTSFERAEDGSAWIATPLTEADTLRLPEIGIEVPVAGFYEGVEFAPPASDEAAP